MSVIEKTELSKWLEGHKNWSYKEPEIVFEKQFKDFVEAFGFLSRVAVLAEKHDHHPAIQNEYNSVRLSMATHDAGNQITNKDLDLAEAIEDIL